MPPADPRGEPVVDAAASLDNHFWDTLSAILRAGRAAARRAGAPTPLAIAHPEVRTAEMPAGRPPASGDKRP